MLRDFIRNLGNAIFGVTVIAVMLAASVAIGLAAVWLVHLVYDMPEGGDVAIFIATAVLILIASAMTLEERCG